ncbi:hypothetical protein AWB78_08734 [Caballeronia calidae]|uniref:Uncharacterized protein n=1 Tax=Caballeronia calidae TaxID=1777139 RepID=A0A158EM20_9BURK|nr:hypothetical protein AWB78_08734 [Caballeronia calidae]
MTRRSGQARLARLLERRELLLRQREPFAFAQQTLTQLGRQRRAIMTPDFVAGEADDEGLVIDLIPAAERGQQFAHPVLVLQHFLLQLAAIAHRLP